MLSCSQFLRDFSDYRDGLMNPAERAAVEAHLAGCSACASYARVVRQGVEELKGVPAIEPSEDFLPRLQNRLYAIQDGYAFPPRGDASATSVGFAVAILLLIGAAAWLPLARPRAALVELPAVVAIAPQGSDTVHSLFRAGPLLRSPMVQGFVDEPSPPTLFSRYTPLRTQAYPTRLNSPR